MLPLNLILHVAKVIMCNYVWTWDLLIMSLRQTLLFDESSLVWHEIRTSSWQTDTVLTELSPIGYEPETYCMWESSPASRQWFIPQTGLERVCSLAGVLIATVLCLWPLTRSGCFFSAITYNFYMTYTSISRKMLASWLVYRNTTDYYSKFVFMSFK